MSVPLKTNINKKFKKWTIVTDKDRERLSIYTQICGVIYLLFLVGCIYQHSSRD